MMTEQTHEEMLRDYDRSMYRSQLVSLFWSIITDRKKEGFTFQWLADKLSLRKRVDKAQVSRWFNGLPNWEANTTSDIAGALGVDLQLVARDRHSGKIYTASGAYAGVSTASSIPHGTTSGEKPQSEATGANVYEGFQITRQSA